MKGRKGVRGKGGVYLIHVHMYDCAVEQISHSVFITDK